MSENDREFTKGNTADDIDSVLSERRRENAAAPRRGEGIARPAAPSGAPAPGRRIQPDMKMWNAQAQGRPAGAAPAQAPRPAGTAPAQPPRPAGTAPAQAPRPASHQPGQRIEHIPTARPAQSAAPQQRTAPQARPAARQAAPEGQQRPAATAPAQPSRSAATAPAQSSRPAAPQQGQRINPVPAAQPSQGAPAQQSAAPRPSVHQIKQLRGRPAAQDDAPDEDVKIAGKKFHAESRKTSAEAFKEAAAPAAPTKKKNDGDAGATIVSGLLKTVIYIVSCTVIAIVLSIFIINVGNDVFAFVKSDEAIDVTIPEGATRSDIADILYDNGVINYKSAFKIYGSIKHIEENFKPGTYTVTPSMNYKQLYSAFKEKPVSGTSWVTIPEGYTVDEIIDLMLSYDIGGTKEDYVREINEGDFSEFDFVKELDENGYSADRFYRLEGYLFPDTYEFYNASDAHTVVKKMLKRFKDVYNDKYRTRAAELGMTTDQVVILASMIEKEAGASSDFRNVSSVFHNRLNSGGAFPYLASDATVVYAIAHERGVRPKVVTAQMMEYNSAYNSYTHPGYPPGAIANPGMNALKYALYPAETYYYYFVSFPNGETVFASTAAEHEANVARLRAMADENNLVPVGGGE